jgi:hypothetical protein
LWMGDMDYTDSSRSNSLRIFSFSGAASKVGL